jgi:opacity protein-like surface antigen
MSKGLKAAAVVLGAAVSAAPAGAADWLWGAGGHAAVPTGSFGDAVDEGWGAAAHLVVLPPARPFGLRLEVSALVYGSRSLGAPLPGGGYQGGALRVDTWFGNMLAGPELRARRGAVRPYAYVLAGLGYFATTTEPAAHGDGTTFDDATFAWAAGGGIEVAVSRDVSIDLGARWLSNGTVDYFVAGATGLSPRRGEPQVVAFTLGIAFGR